MRGAFVEIAHDLHVEADRRARDCRTGVRRRVRKRDVPIRPRAVDDQKGTIDRERARIAAESELHCELLCGEAAEQPFVAPDFELERVCDRKLGIGETPLIRIAHDQHAFVERFHCCCAGIAAMNSESPPYSTTVANATPVPAIT